MARWLSNAFGSSVGEAASRLGDHGTPVPAKSRILAAA
jgi:hypothetical protein